MQVANIELSKEKVREIIAKRVAKELKKGDVVTLGIGLPTAVANYVPESMNIIFQAENGLLGFRSLKEGEEPDKKVIDAGGTYVKTIPGSCFYDTQMSFTIMRGGHIDATVLGALQVDQEANLASWLIPGKFVPGIGGAMDLVIGAKKVIVAMEHMAKDKVKIVKKCNLPLTATNEVDLIVTERCVLETTSNGLLLTEINPMFTVEDIKNSVTADIIVADDLKEMEI